MCWSPILDTGCKSLQPLLSCGLVTTLQGAGSATVHSLTIHWGNWRERDGDGGMEKDRERDARRKRGGGKGGILHHDA